MLALRLTAEMTPKIETPHLVPTTAMNKRTFMRLFSAMIANLNLGHVNQFAQGRIDGSLVRKILSHVR